MLSRTDRPDTGGSRHGNAGQRASWPWVVAALLNVALAAGSANAGSFEVTPIRVEVVPGQMTTTISLRNLSEEASSVQARASAWAQAGDEDTLTPTQDIVLSPPIFTIPPGQVQTVRLLLRTRDAQPEHPWRLLFDEVPPPGKAGQIALAMRLSVPVLIETPGAQKPVLSWRAVREANGQVAMVVNNTGHRPARLTEAVLHLSDGTAVTLRPVAQNPYVLPGAERHWRPAQAPAGKLIAGAALRLTATTQSGPMEQSVTVP